MKCNKKAFIKKKYAKIKIKEYKSMFWLKYKIYICPICKFYHLTTNLKDQKFFRTNK